jgi:phenylalanyl-tRNA synthetase beta chain
VDGSAIGVVGEVHPRVLERFDIEEASVGLFELDLEGLLRVLPSVERRYRPIPRFPSAVRDISILVDLSVPAVRVQEAIERHRLVSQATLFDVYTGPEIPEGKRSLAYRIYFQSPERTLSTEEVNHAFGDIVSSLRREVGAILRGKEEVQGRDAP